MGWARKQFDRNKGKRKDAKNDARRPIKPDFRGINARRKAG